MTQYHRTISGMSISAAALPAWVSTIAAPNTLYNIGELTSEAQARSVAGFPGSVAPDYFYQLEKGSTAAGAIYAGINGWQGQIHLEDVGTHGAWVTGNAGEACLMGHMGNFDISRDSPRFEWWTLPWQARSMAESIATDGDMYWSPSDFANDAVVKPACRFADPTYNIPNTLDVNSNAVRGAWLAMSDANRYPFGYNNWVWRRRTVKDTHGNKMPTGCGRYNGNCYIPPEMTGTGAGALFRHGDTLTGPTMAWSFCFGYPGIQESDVCAEAWPSGRRKYYAHVENTQTRVQDIFPTPVPDHSYAGWLGPINRNLVQVDRWTKRVWVFGYGNPVNQPSYYLDLTNGLSGATWSAVNTTSPTWMTATPTPGVNGQYSGTYDNGVYRFCHVQAGGRRLMYWCVNSYGGCPPNWVGVYDFDQHKIWWLNLGTRGMTVPQYVPAEGLIAPNTGATPPTAIGYDEAMNRVIITQHEPSNVTEANRFVYSSVFEIPSDHTNVNAYNVQTTKLALGPGVTLQRASRFCCGDSGKYMKYLGGTILVPQWSHNGYQMAYKPY